MRKQHLTVNVALFQTCIWILYIRMPYLMWFQMISNTYFVFHFSFFSAMIFICIRCRIPDCEKSLENVYESVCGSEISDFLGNQRTTPNSQNYTAANAKPFSSVTNGKYLEFFLSTLISIWILVFHFERAINRSFAIDGIFHDHWLRWSRFNQNKSFHRLLFYGCVWLTDSTLALKWNWAAFKCSTSIIICFLILFSAH